MALHAVCPECGTTETLADDYAAHTIECRRCQHIFATPTTQSAPATQAAPRPPALPQSKDAPPEPTPEPGFDLVEGDDAPLPKKSTKSKNTRADDYDDDDEPAPRPRPAIALPPRKKPSPVPVVLLALLALLMGGGSAWTAAYMLTPKLVDPSVVKNDPPRPNPNDNNNNNNPIFPKNDPKPPIADKNTPPVPTAKDALSVYATKVTTPYTTLNLPGKTTDACAGAEGRLLFFFVPTQQAIVVVDLCEAKIRKTLPTVSKNIRLTATLDKLFVVDAETRQAERWDLRTLAKDLTIPKLPGNGDVVGIAAGCATTGPILVSNDELDPNSGRPFTFVDDKLQDAGYVWEGRVGDWNDFVGFPNLRCTADGVHWYCTDAAPPGAPPEEEALNIERTGINSVAIRVRKLPAGVIAPSQIHNSVSGRIYARNTVHSSSANGGDPVPLYNKAQRIYPPVTGPFGLLLLPGLGAGPKGMPTSPTGSRRLMVNDDSDGFLNEPKLAQSSKLVPSPIAQEGDPLPWDREVFYVPLAETVALVNGSRDRVELTSYPLISAASGLVSIGFPANRNRYAFVCGNAPNTFTPGQPYEYQASMTHAFNDVSVTLLCFQTQDAATKFKASNRGLVTWDVPANFDKPYVDLHILYVPLNANTAAIAQEIRLFNTATRAVDSKPKIDPKPKVDPKPKDPTPMPPVVPTDFAPGVQLVKPAAKVPALTPVAFEGPSTTVNAPGAITDLCIGGGGRFVLIHVPTQRKVSVFDVSTAKFVGALKTEEDNLFIAAGAEKALLVYPDKKRVERWNLTTFTKEAEKVLDVKQTITAAAMGNATAGPLVLGGPKAQNNASKMALMFVDIDSFKEVKIDNADGKFGVTFGAPANLRVSSNGKLISAWFKDSAPSGVQMVELTGNALRGVYLPENAGQVIASADAKFVGTNLGMFLPNTERSGPPTDVVLPAVQKGGFLVLTPQVANHYRKVTVVPETGDPLGTFENLPSYDGKRDPFDRETTPLTLDQRIIFVPDAKALIVIPPAGNKLHIFKVPPMK